jgi:hypothetical protein
VDLETYLNIHHALAGTSSGIFAILLGFTLFMLNSGNKKIELSTSVLLGLGIFGSLIATATSTLAMLLGYFTKGTVEVGTIYVSSFCLFTSIISLGILTFLALSSLYTEQVREERGSWDFMRLK